MQKAKNDGEPVRFHFPTVIVILFVTFVGFCGQQAAALFKNQDISGFVSEAVAGANSSYTCEFKSKPIDVKPGQTKIRIDNQAGNFNLIPSTDGKFYVEARIVGWGPTDAEAKRRAEMVKINISEGQVINVARSPEKNNNIRYQADVSYRIIIPKGVDVDIQNNTGQIKADNLDANLNIDYGNGDILLSGIRGDITVDGSSGRADFRDIAGKLDIRTDSGDINVLDAGKDVRVESENGRVEVAADRPVDANYSIVNRNGQIVCRLSDKSNTTLTAQTVNGAISGSLGLKMENDEQGNQSNSSPSGNSRERHVTGARGTTILGNGKGSISLYNETGSIIIDKN